MPNRSPDAVTPGTLSPVDVRRAFVEGAQWWEYETEGATMWPSDRNDAEAEAVRRYGAAPVCEWGEKLIPACGGADDPEGEFRFCPFCGRTIKREEANDE